jgi:hypothetical protein
MLAGRFTYLISVDLLTECLRASFSPACKGRLRAFDEGRERFAMTSATGVPARASVATSAKRHRSNLVGNTRMKPRPPSRTSPDPRACESVRSPPH